MELQWALTTPYSYTLSAEVSWCFVSGITVGTDNPHYSDTLGAEVSCCFVSGITVGTDNPHYGYTLGAEVVVLLVELQWVLATPIIATPLVLK